MIDPTIQRLFWKDYRILRPLLPWALGLTVVLNLYPLLGSHEMKTGEPFDTAVAMGILVPHLFALFAPLTLVITEHGNHTSPWLRELPIPERRIIASRVMAGFAGLFCIWVFSSIVFALITRHTGIPMDELTRGGAPLPIGLVAMDLLISSSAVLMVGFVFSYGLQGNVISLALIAIFGWLSIFEILEMTGIGRFRDEILLLGGGSRIAWGASIGLVAWLLQRSIAEWQMRRSDDFKFPWQKAAKRSNAESGTRRRTERGKPSAWHSLLWQQFRQILPYAIVWSVGTFLIIGGLWLVFDESRGSNYLLGPSVQGVGFLGACSLGVLVFYGDARNGRKTFLADRGVAAFQVWWTRLLPVLIAYLPFQLLQHYILTRISVFTAIDENTVFEPSAAIAATLVIFACGAFVSQWFRPPILAFVAVPSLALGVIGTTFLTFRHGSWATLSLFQRQFSCLRRGE